MSSVAEGLLLHPTTDLVEARVRELDDVERVRDLDPVQPITVVVVSTWIRNGSPATSTTPSTVNRGQTHDEGAHARSVGLHRGSPESVGVATPILVEPLYRACGPLTSAGHTPRRSEAPDCLTGLDAAEFSEIRGEALALLDIAAGSAIVPVDSFEWGAGMGRIRKVGSVVASAALLALGACSNGGSQAADNGPLVDPPEQIGPPSRVIHYSEAYGVATLSEVAALSTVVVEGTVAKVDVGPVIGDEGALGLLLATVSVERVYAGPSDLHTVNFLFHGYDPETSEVSSLEHNLWPTAGTTGIWFLRPTELEAAPDAFYVVTSAGELHRNEDGTTRTGGDLEASSLACRVPWTQAQSMVAEAVRSAEGTTPLEPGVDSPLADPSFAGNPCAEEIPPFEGDSHVPNEEVEGN